jgi:AcrR family transcriptional regulator
MLEALALGPSSKRVAVIGGSKSTLYARFGGKDGLLASAVTHHCADVDVAIDVQARGDTAAQLTQIGRSFLKAVLDPRTLDVYRLMVSIGKTFPSLSRLFYESGPKSAYAIVARWIETQQLAGKLKPDNADRLAALFLDMLLGEHQLALLLSVPNVSTSRTINVTVDTAVSVFMFGSSNRG